MKIEKKKLRERFIFSKLEFKDLSFSYNQNKILFKIKTLK